MPSPQQSAPLYEEILFEKLHISRDFYKKRDRLKVFRDKLAGAADGMRGGLSEFGGINLCIHVASSAVLLGSEDAQVKRTLTELKERFLGIDPTTVVTAGSLYYIIRTVESQCDLNSVQKESIEYLRKRFGEMNWLVGADRMRELGFE